MSYVKWTTMSTIFSISNNISFKKRWFIPYIILVVGMIILGFTLAFYLNIINLKSFVAGTYLMISKDDVINDLKGSIYLDPELYDPSDKYYGYKTSDEYLSATFITKSSNVCAIFPCI